MTKKNHGGKRPGAGRRPSPYGQSVQVTLPAQWLPMFEVWLAQRKADHDAAYGAARAHNAAMNAIAAVDANETDERHQDG